MKCGNRGRVHFLLQVCRGLLAQGVMWVSNFLPLYCFESLQGPKEKRRKARRREGLSASRNRWHPSGGERYLLPASPADALRVSVSRPPRWPPSQHSTPSSLVQLESLLSCSVLWSSLYAKQLMCYRTWRIFQLPWNHIGLGTLSFEMTGFDLI